MPNTSRPNSTKRIVAVPAPALVFPIDPATLNRMLQASLRPGEAWWPHHKWPFLCPPGGTTLIRIRVPKDWVAVYATPVMLTSDYYSGDLLAAMCLDDEITYASWFPLTGPTALDLAYKLVAFWKVEIGVYNGLDHDVTVTVESEVGLLETSFYFDWYRPVFEYQWDLLNLLVAARGGKPR